MIDEKNILNKSDEDLVGLTKNNPDFYYYLVRRYENKILRYIRRISNVSAETAQDLGQEIFIKAYKNINDFDRSLKFSSWIYRIAHNHVISWWRRNKKDKLFLSWDADPSYKNMFEANIDLAKEIDDKILERFVKTALGNIKEQYREVLVLRFMEDKDYAEISDILKKPVGTVGTLILRAKIELKKEIIKLNIWKTASAKK